MKPRTLSELAAASPDVPREHPAPLRALLLEAAGDWEGAHRAVQDDASREAAWVHAYLHRVEGDLGNAGYWYRRAGRPAEQGPLGAERDAIAGELLRGGKTP